MKQFSGFPKQSKYTSLPNLFFSSLLPEINDLVELKVTLHIFEILYPKKGYPKYVTFHELLNNISLLKSLHDENESPEQLLREALQKAIARGTILTVSINSNGVSENIYFLNSEADRQIISRIQRGEMREVGLQPDITVASPPVAPSDIFAMYEENIGMLTPLVADELREAEKTYPVDWLRDAIKEAVNLNKRNWRYMSRILERWATEGKSDGTHRRYNKENTDPDKYIKGRYGHIVKR